MVKAPSTTPSLIKLIIFMVITILATSVLAATIANIRIGPTTEYRAVFSDAFGVIGGDDVRIAGVRVGEVTDVKIAKDRTTVDVGFSVDADRKLARSTRIKVNYRNLLGQRYLALSEGSGDLSPLKEGETIPLAQTTPALDLQVLFNGFKPLFAALSPQDVNKFADEVVKTLQGEGGTINSLLAHTGSLTAALADRDQLIGNTIDNLNVLLATVADRDEQLSELILQLQRFVSGLAEERKAIGASLDNINALTTNTADLLKGIRPSLRADIKELGILAETLSETKGDRSGAGYNHLKGDILLEEFIDRLPGKLNTIIRTASYGSYFNFYLCRADILITMPNGTKLPPVTVHNAVDRCTEKKTL